MINRFQEGALKFSRSKFTVLLMSLMALILIAPMLAHMIWMRWFVTFSFIAIILASVYVLNATVHNIRGFIVLAFLAILIQLISTVYEHSLWLVIDNLVICVMLLSAVVAMYHDIIAENRINLDTMLGAICMYIMIGIVYGEIYSIIAILQPGAFVHDVSVLVGKTVTNFDLHYFSLITLTTAGYGDILPVTGFAKAVVMIESITGIFFLAILVARMVALQRYDDVDKQDLDA